VSSLRRSARVCPPPLAGASTAASGVQGETDQDGNGKDPVDGRDRSLSEEHGVVKRQPGAGFAGDKGERDERATWHPGDAQRAATGVFDCDSDHTAVPVPSGSSETARANESRVLPLRRRAGALHRRECRASQIGK